MKLRLLLGFFAIVIVLPLLFSIIGLFLKNPSFVIFGLTVSLVLLTAYLVVSTSRIEEYQRRLSDLEKFQIGAQIFDIVRMPQSYFGNVKLMEADLQNLADLEGNDAINYVFNTSKQEIVLRFRLNLERQVRETFIKYVKPDYNDKVLSDLRTYDDL